VFWLLIAKIYPLKIRGCRDERGDDGELAGQLRRHGFLPDAA
jgi:hypothetical protein